MSMLSRLSSLFKHYYIVFQRYVKSRFGGTLILLVEIRRRRRNAPPRRFVIRNTLCYDFFAPFGINKDERTETPVFSLKENREKTKEKYEIGQSDH